MNIVRQIFFANWKNKVVALFFAISIWFVAYQSETSTFTVPLQVSLQPLNSAEMVVIGSTVKNTKGMQVGFNGEVEVKFSGPRKQIDQLKQDLQREHALWIPADGKVHEFTQEDFGFPRERITITSIEPASVEIRQEPMVEKRIVDLVSKIQVEPYIPGYDVIKEIVKPESQSVRLRIPKSLEDSASVKISVSMPYDREEIEGLFDLRVTSDDEILARRTVLVWDFNEQRWVRPPDAPHVHLRVRLAANSATWERDAVRVTFRLPAMQHPYKVFFQNAPDGTIPVKFFGPKNQIEKLKKKFEENPKFSVSVPAPPSFEQDKDQDYSVTEDLMEVPGFPEVQIQQHDSRKKGRESAWILQFKVYPTEEGKDN